jgi:beta-exotoxin I transport system permease protein
VSAATLALSVRMRIVSVCMTTAGVVAVILTVGALFPAVGDSIGQLDLPKGVRDLLGGADYGTLSGWFKSEIGAVYGPLVIAAMAIVAATGSTAGEEDDGILAMVLAHPVSRSALIVAKATAVAIEVSIIAFGIWLGLIAGVALGGGGISIGDLAALSLHLAFFGFASGAVALAVAAATGNRGLAAAVAGGVGILGFLVNGFAPLVDGLSWLKYLSPFFYYDGNDPLANGVDLAHLAVLAAIAGALTALAVFAFGRRDLRA